jgi:hypothetical protein
MTTPTETQTSVLALRVLAVGSLSLALMAERPPFAATFAILGLLLFARTIWGNPPRAESDFSRFGAWLPLGILLLSLLISRKGVPDSVAAARLPAAVIGGMACLAVLFGAGRRAWRVVGVTLALSSAVVVTAQVAITEWNSDLGSDIYHAHKAGGDALLDGENPFSDAVRFFNGSPNVGPGAVFEGYPYPPIVLFTFGLVGGLTDPRLVSIVAWFAVLAWFAKAALSTRDQSDGHLVIFLMLATLPEWPLLLFMSWTEPLSLALFLAAALTWRRSAVVSGILLGLALASKQYLVFLAPLLLLHRDQGWRKRAATATATALVVLVPPLLIDPVAYYDAIIGNPTGVGFRPDSVSLMGLLDGFGIRFEPAHWVWLVYGLAVAVLVSLGSRVWSTFLGRAGLILGLTFFMSVAFANYWFLIMGMVAISTILDDRDRTTVMGSV